MRLSTTPLAMTLNEALTMRRYKLVPPDGRYGYVIVAAASVNLVAVTMFFVCFGMIFNDFFIKLKMGSTGVSLLTGIKALAIAVSGFLTGPLLKVMSRRKLAFVGSVFFNAGAFGAAFVHTKMPFIVCVGLIQSVGFGFLFNTSWVAVNDFFVEKRMLFMTFVQTFASASSMVAPILITWSMAEYGYHGTLIVMSAIGVQSFAASALLQPVAWHMRRVKVANGVPEKKLLLQTEPVHEPKNLPSQTPDVAQHDAENADSGFLEEKEHAKPPGCNVVTRLFRKYLDWQLFKRYVLTCGGLGIPTAIFADITYVYFLPPALYAIGWDNDKVKWAFALLGFGDITCRVIIILLSPYLKKVSTHLLYFFGLLLAIGTRLAMLWVTDYTSTLAIMAVMGVSRCMIVVLIPLVFSEYVGRDKFPSAMGISFMMFGLMSIVLGPVIGAISDATRSRAVMFMILTSLLTVVAVAWLFEMWWNRRRTRGPQTLQK